jgi:hypothetical protein
MTVEQTNASAAPAATPVSTRRCENCGTPLYGPHCHACGQPIKGLVRHFSSVLGDFFDTVFNIDSRVLRTVGPLLTRPGYLSLEYFAGRRVRYVTPMRLFLFLSLLMFFAIQGSIEINEQNDIIRVDDDKSSPIDRAQTPEQVKAVTDQALRDLASARKDAAQVPGANVGLEMAEQKLQEHAGRRIAYLRSVEAARAAHRPLPQPPQASDNKFDFPVNGKPWDPQRNPITFGWLPAPVNKALNRRMGHARDVLRASNSEKPWVDALFNVLPQTLIVLMPLFALMLKVAYWFKRRLYMEHLIVALHSHSFISLALTLVLALSWLQNWLAPGGGFWNGLFGWGMGLISGWIPVYLLLMQKRVYAQGWPMTLAKFCVLGLCYTVLLSLGLIAATLVGLLTL